MSTDLLSELTEAQRQAVTHLSGPCLVVAGAGTGKTKVITHRIAYLIQEQGIPAEKIVALTFTDKAAREMQERLDELLNYGQNNTIIATFHSFCADLLKRHAFLLGIDPASRLMSSADEVSFLRQNLQELPTKLYKPSKNPVEFLRSLITFLSRAKDEDLNPEQIIQHAKELATKAKDEADQESAEKLKELALIYQATQRLYADNSLLSYGDLISQVAKLLREFPSVRKEEAAKIQFLLIDEFQDTNYVQSEVARLLMGENGNIMAVGDDDQAIYSFRGANLANILTYTKTYQNCRVITLADNFRSTQAILDASYQLIQYNNPDRLEVGEGISKQLRSHTTAGEPPEHWHFERSIFEYEAIAKQISQFLENKTYQAEDIAILVRSKSHAKGIEQMLQANNIECHYAGDIKFYNLPVVQAAISYLRFLVNPDNDSNLFFCLTQPPFSVTERCLQKYTTAARYQTISLFDYLQSNQDQLEVRLKSILVFLQKRIEEGTNHLPSHLFLHFLHESKWQNQLKEQPEDLDVLVCLHQEISAFEAVHSHPNLASYITYLDYLISSEEDITLQQAPDLAASGVRIMTIHKSKGLEFPVVFVVNLVQGRFPSRNYSDSLPFPEQLTHQAANTIETNLQEERRLAYVAMTRAKERLYLTSSELYDERKTKAKPSPFIIEALGTISLPQAISAEKSAVATSQPKMKVNPPARQRLAAPMQFSPSALETYQQCPKKYEYQYVLKVKIPPNHFSNFGISIHESLKRWFSQQQSGGTQTMANIYQSCWIKGGYENKQIEEERYREGLQKLEEYITSIEAQAKPIALEFSCRAQLENGFSLLGKIDRVDPLLEGGYKVIDYKTSEKAKKGKDLFLDIPLGTYALALQQSGKDVKEVELQYIMIGEKVSISTSDLDLSGIQTKVQETIQQIRDDFQNQSFIATPEKMKCQYCDYRAICPFRYGKL